MFGVRVPSYVQLWMYRVMWNPESIKPYIVDFICRLTHLHRLMVAFLPQSRLSVLMKKEDRQEVKL